MLSYCDQIEIFGLNVQPVSSVHFIIAPIHLILRLTKTEFSLSEIYRSWCITLGSFQTVSHSKKVLEML